MLGRALTSVPWGMVADRYGRKPVIIIGTVAVLVHTTITQLIYLLIKFEYLLIKFECFLQNV